MSTRDGRYTIVYNGEVYNFVDLRRELEALGVRFRSRSDTEVVLEAYARWGAACVGRLRGMFAFGIWDKREQTLFLARDRLGIKPLYYNELPDGLAFASEVRALLATGLAQRELSRDGLASYLVFGSVYEPLTILKGLRAVPAGHTITWSDRARQPERYWQVPVLPDEIHSTDAALEALRPVLDDAVRSRLVADVPVGVFLSGGVDSSAVAALASRHQNAALRTFTVTFDEKRFDEGRFAAEVARHLGCDHQEAHLSASEAQEQLPASIAALDQPSADGPNAYIVSKAAREAGLSVALSGLGGDELFAGYRYFRLFGPLRWLASVGGYVSAAGTARMLASPWADRLPNAARKLFLATTTRGQPAPLYELLRAMFTPDRVRELAPGLGGDRPSFLPPQVASAAAGDVHPVNAWGALDLSGYLRNTLLRDTDSMSMAHGLEVRVPLIDQQLVGVAARIAGGTKVAGTVNKALLGRCADLPKVSTHRPKMGFTLPFAAWLRGPLRHLLEPSSLDRSLAGLGVFSPSGLDRMRSGFLRGERYVSYARIWSLIALAEWCRTNAVAAVA